MIKMLEGLWLLLVHAVSWTWGFLEGLDTAPEHKYDRPRRRWWQM